MPNTPKHATNAAARAKVVPANPAVEAVLPSGHREFGLRVDEGEAVVEGTLLKMVTPMVRRRQERAIGVIPTAAPSGGRANRWLTHTG